MEQNNNTIRVFLVDDHRVVIEGLRHMLENEPGISCVGETNHGKMALAKLNHQEADVVLMDVNMPVMDGIEACKKIKAKYPETRVLLLTMLKEASTIKKALKAGADGYLLKHEGKEEVLHAIRTVDEGKPYHNEEVTRLVMSSFSVQKGAMTGGLPRISRREKQILKLIVEEFTTAEIAKKLFVSTHTVESHRKNLLMKLGARNTAGLVRIALEHSLIE